MARILQQETKVRVSVRFNSMRILQQETRVRVSVRFNVIIFIIMVIFQNTVRGRGILKCGEEKHTSSQRGDNQMPKQANKQVSNLLNKKDIFFT